MNNAPYWEICPKCGGEGKVVVAPISYNDIFEKCPVCKGAMIINTLTGLPPMGSPSPSQLKTDNNG